MISLRRIQAVARKELIHLFRDKRMRPIVFVVPMLQLGILGVAANLDVENMRLLVIDQDHSVMSRDIAARVDATSAFKLVGVSSSEADATEALDQGTAELVLLVPHGAGRALTRGEAAEVAVWLDGTDTNRALIGQAALASVLRDVSTAHLPPAGRSLPLPGTPEARVRVRFNPTLQSRWFMIPGVMGSVLTVLTILLSAMAIVREKEIGTIEQLSVTPVRPVELVAGKLLPFVLVGLIVATLVFLVAVFGFQVPFRGSLLTLLGLSLLYLLSTLGLGLLVSTSSATQQQAMLSSILVLLPSFLLGGVFYPVFNMPLWGQWIADLIPMRYFLTAMRSLFIRGSSVADLWRESLALGVLGVFLLGLAVIRFRKRSV
ncbi:MAG: ABC transporter permease [Deltaproteobacteria bacterium]|nr:ABC transporter permease [Deltaproteobacteria bacterium]